MLYCCGYTLCTLCVYHLLSWDDSMSKNNTNITTIYHYIPLWSLYAGLIFDESSLCICGICGLKATQLHLLGELLDLWLSWQRRPLGLLGPPGPLGPRELWDPWDSGIRSRGQIQEPSFEPRHLQSGPVLVLYSYRKSMAQWHRYFLHFLRLEVIVGRVTEIHSLAWGVLIH